MIVYATVLIVVALLSLAYSGATDKQMRDKYLIPKTTPEEFNCNTAKQEIDEGLTYLKNKKVIIAGLIRDSEDVIDVMKTNVKKLESVFADYRVLVVENNSHDKTRKILLDWVAENPKVTVLGCGVNADTCDLRLPKTVIHDNNSTRIGKMVLLRNIYMDYITTNINMYEGFEFIIAMDFDIEGTFYTDGIGSSGYYFKKNPKMQGLCANGIRLMKFGPFRWKDYHDGYAHKDDITRISPLWNTWYTCSSGITRLKSCFNGFTMYKLDSIMGKHYALDEKEGRAVCEHVTLNEQLDQMYINPKMIFVIINNK